MLDVDQMQVKVALLSPYQQILKTEPRWIKNEEWSFKNDVFNSIVVHNVNSKY